MRVGAFSLAIEGKSDNGQGLVALGHGEQYKLDLRNHGDRPCDVEVKVDGKHVGTWQLPAYARASLERGIEDRGKFTAYRAGTSEAVVTGVDAVTAEERGLIQATFKPQFRAMDMSGPLKAVLKGGVRGQSVGGSYEGYLSAAPVTDFGGGATLSSANVSRGLESAGTGLSGHSNQNFTTVKGLDHAPESEWSVISLRIAVPADGPRPIVEVKEPVIAPKANPVPPPV